MSTVRTDINRDRVTEATVAAQRMDQASLNRTRRWTAAQELPNPDATQVDVGVFLIDERANAFRSLFPSLANRFNEVRTYATQLQASTDNNGDNIITHEELRAYAGTEGDCRDAMYDLTLYAHMLSEVFDEDLEEAPAPIPTNPTAAEYRARNTEFQSIDSALRTLCSELGTNLETVLGMNPQQLHTQAINRATQPQGERFIALVRRLVFLNNNVTGRPTYSPPLPQSLTLQIAGAVFVNEYRFTREAFSTPLTAASVRLAQTGSNDIGRRGPLVFGAAGAIVLGGLGAAVSRPTRAVRALAGLCGAILGFVGGAGLHWRGQVIGQERAAQRLREAARPSTPAPTPSVPTPSTPAASPNVTMTPIPPPPAPTVYPAPPPVPNP